MKPRTTKTLNPLPEIWNRYNRILASLEREARRDDMQYGWDWPTLRIVKPDTYTELKSLERAYRSEAIALRSAGLLPMAPRGGSK